MKKQPHFHNPTYQRPHSFHGSHAPMHDGNAPMHDVNAPMHDVNAPMHDVNAPMHDGNAPMHDVNAPMHDVNAPMHDVNAPMHDVNAPMHDVNAPMQQGNATRRGTHIVANPEHEATYNTHVNNGFDASNRQLITGETTDSTVLSSAVSSDHFQCEICMKKFVSNITLNIHRNIHTGKKKSCKRCDKSFSDPASLSRHKKKYNHFW
ncbi:unnamed protein product [Owenia fusiformis]|uniref:Uncharacterized protein n=1 Tax=Owenia fusiformis TaxID=6347 RepID=A0A8J1TJJ9_OWEFU|nr:unnamed protein product [Owenia fusiformis]